jgi:hypothetical protein
MRAVRPTGARWLIALWVLIAGAASAAPKNYVFTGKFTSNRGALLNLPLVGDTPCAGVGLANLRIMSGPGLTGPHTLFSMTAMTMQPNPTPTVHPFSQLANGDKYDYQCVGYNKGKKVVTTGAGVGGNFTVPTKVLNHPLPGVTTVVHVANATPIIQLATSFKFTGPRSVIPANEPPLGGSMANGTNTAAFRAFKKGAWATQTGRVGSMFTWCWGNPNCANVTQGAKPLIVKYFGGGNAFGGTMAYVISSGNPSSVAIGLGGGLVGFAVLPVMGSQPTGRGYASFRSEVGPPGQVWAAYMTGYRNGHHGYQKQITMVYGYIGPAFPPVHSQNFGFPFTTMTVLARNTGTVGGNKRDTTLTAKGGDTVTAMGKRNLSLVAGGVAFVESEAEVDLGPFAGHHPHIVQMYVPEPSRAAQLLAGALGLLAIAAARQRRR